MAGNKLLTEILDQPISWIKGDKGKGTYTYLTEPFQGKLEKEILSKIREVVEGAGLTDEVHFYLHANTPYKLQSKEMDAFLKGVGGGSRAMKHAILKAIGGIDGY